MAAVAVEIDDVGDVDCLDRDGGGIPTETGIKTWEGGL